MRHVVLLAETRLGAVIALLYHTGYRTSVMRGVICAPGDTRQLLVSWRVVAETRRDTSRVRIEDAAPAV